MNQQNKKTIMIMAALLIITGSHIIFTTQAASTTLHIAAASSTHDAFNEIARNFEKDTGIKITLTFSATGALATQTEHGAPFDILATADESKLKKLSEKGLILNSSIQPYATGTLILATNKNDPLLTQLEDLLNPDIKKIAIANPNYAPYGMAAKQALQKAGLWEAVQPKLIYAQNIHQTQLYIQSGEVDASITALSLADKSKINYIEIDQNLHKPIKQTIGIIKTSQSKQAAEQFIAYLNTQGQPTLQKYGLLTTN